MANDKYERAQIKFAARIRKAEKDIELMKDIYTELFDSRYTNETK